MILYGGPLKDGGSTPDGIGGGGSAVVLKKGPWTAAEDEILAAYVREHGEGNWNAVQKNTGLARCGKSCRLRWANHLRPNLKKGAFTADEERLIIQLHAQLGNKWARMAAQLPGRTDNEIKNYWNTRLKRLQRQGLPLYPADIIPNHHLHHHQQHLYLQSQPQTQPQPLPTTPTSPTSGGPTTTATSSSSFTFQTTTTANLLRPLSPTPCHTPTTPQTPSTPPPLSPSSLSSPHHYSTTSSLFALHDNNIAFTFPRPTPLLQSPSLRMKRFNINQCTNIVPPSVNNGISVGPFSPIGKSSYSSFLTLPYSSPATPTGASSYHNSNESVTLLGSSCPSSSPLHSFSPYHSSASLNHQMIHTHFTPESVYSMKMELPLNQMSHTGLYDVTNEKHHHHQHHHHHEPQQHHRSTCELLENVLEEAEALASGGRASKRRQVMALSDGNNNNDNNNNVLNSFGHYGTSNGGFSSPQGLKAKEDESLEMNAMQEDIAKLLDWGSDSGEISNGHSSVVTDDNLILDIHQFASLFPVEASAAATDNDHNKNTTSCSWDNLPRIC